MVYTSADKGITWTEKRPSDRILVIAPGAGTYANKKAYDHLRRNFDVEIMDTRTRDGGFKYPDGWGDMTQVDLHQDGDESLMGLARKIGAHVVGHSPQMIIAGSRGGQVIIPVLLMYFWRGPFAVINAGNLMTNTPIPSECDPWFITCGDDYFPTRDLEYVADNFKKLSHNDGHQIHMPDQPHMPQLTNTMLTNVVHHIVHGQPLSPRFNVVKLRGHAIAAAASAPLQESKPMFTIEHSSQCNVYLRRRATKERIWYSDERYVNNGDEVVITKQATDEDMYLMLYVEEPDSGVRGWVYAKNIAELK